MYRPGETIAEALRRIQSKRYVLPTIQREFVWRPEQIERLFDSLKLTFMPEDWPARYKTDEASRADYRDRYVLGTLPVDLAHFDRFYEERRQSLRGRVSALLEGAAAEQLPEAAE